MFDDEGEGSDSPDKRRSRRRRTLKRGHVVSSETDLRFGCRIADINDHGARLVMALGVPPPQVFTLRIDLERQEVDCRIIRQSGREIAVVFIGPFRFASEGIHTSLFPSTETGKDATPGRRLLRRSRATGEH